MAMQSGILLFVLFTAVASADLQNPSFESPPLIGTSTTNSTTPFILLNQSISIPGWTMEGTVEYVTSSPETPLLPQANGHAIKLGQDGEINQTFITKDGVRDHLLTFVLAPVSKNCSNSTGVIISVPDRSSLISLEQRFGREAWETHGVYLGMFGDRESVNVIFKSSLYEDETNSSCGPILDSLLLKEVGGPAQYAGNLLTNGGFEVGPAFLSNLVEGILLDSAPTHTQSVLQQWSIKGTVKYINSKNYLVPEGNAAIEIVSEILGGGVETIQVLTVGATYNLDFMIGDANDSCVGEFLVGVQAGSTSNNFTFLSNGMGLVLNNSISFKVVSKLTRISFLSYKTTQTKELVFCGPVIDNIVLQASNGLRFGLQTWVLFSNFIFLVLQISGLS